MSTRKDKSKENADGQYPKGWLNLSLGEYLGASNSPASRPIKVHKCNFCKRMFYSSQALGGHQNAHKKERDAVKRYLSPNSEMNFMVQPHSLAHTPNTVGEETTIASFADDGVTWVQPCDQAIAVGSNWPGRCIYVEAQTASQLSDQTHMLDLNLKL